MHLIIPSVRCLKRYYGDDGGDGELNSEETPKHALDQVQEVVPHVINMEAYKPIVDKDRIWILSELDLG
jgi:hypothetical protein